MAVQLHNFSSQDPIIFLRRSSRIRNSYSSLPPATYTPSRRRRTRASSPSHDPNPSPRTLRALKRRKLCAADHSHTLPSVSSTPSAKKRRSLSVGGDDVGRKKKRKENLLAHDDDSDRAVRKRKRAAPKEISQQASPVTTTSKPKSSCDSSAESPSPSPRPASQRRSISPPPSTPSPTPLPSTAQQPQQAPTSSPSSSDSAPYVTFTPLSASSSSTATFPEPEHFVPSQAPSLETPPPLSPPSLLSRLGPGPLTVGVRHKDTEHNIWKVACQERVDHIFRRYGAHTIRAVVASQSRPSSPVCLSTSTSTQFRLYTPANYQDQRTIDDNLPEEDIECEYDTSDDEEDEDEETDLTDDPSFTLSLITPTPPSPPPPPLMNSLSPPSPLPSLSTLPVPVLAEPRLAYMGRGTPPDRRRRNEWSASATSGGLFLPLSSCIPSFQQGDAGFCAWDVSLRKESGIDGLTAIFDPNPGEWSSFLQSLLGPPSSQLLPPPSSALSPPSPAPVPVPVDDIMPAVFGAVPQDGHAQQQESQSSNGMNWFELAPPQSHVPLPLSASVDVPIPVSIPVESSTLSYALG